ncbi:MAG: helix-turn-helix domain-containing protein [Candidatus Woesearchaeota archaeon]
MRTSPKQITITTLKKPLNVSLNEELKWFGSSLGLLSERDKDSSMFRVFIELVKSTKKHTALTSEQISLTVGLTRGAVIRHLKKLTNAGMVVHEGRRYSLRDDNLARLMEELKKDINRSLDDLHTVAQEIDAQLGM